ncbi:MAG: PAS domain-containing protein [Proteobacteria bacterium]|nr:PAS domain-containing protein [Pseudomonadota bacterium]
MPRPDFEALFRHLPSPHMVLDREFRFVDANDAYCAVTERRRDELIGRGVFEMFPNDGDAGRRLRESLDEVLATGKPHSIPLIPYPISLPQTRGGGFEMRYWSAIHTPLLDEAGATRFIVQNTVDVTELQRLKEIAFGPGEERAADKSVLLQRAQEVERANTLLQEEKRNLRDLFMQAPGFMAVLAGRDLVFSLVNQTYQQLIGHRPVIGKTLTDALPELRGQGFDDLLRQVMRSGEPYIGTATSVFLQRTSGAPMEERFLDFIYQPMRGADGTVWGVFIEGSDVTDRVHAERQQKLLVDELNHRVKNILVTVQAIANHSLRTTADPASVRKDFESRLVALAATHNLLTASNWRATHLRDVLMVEFQPHGAERYSLQGPDVELSPSEAVALGLLFHELATNAAKYGALSAPEGRIEVSWSVDDAARLALEWREGGGPPVSAPARRGFGSRLIERSLKGALRGEATLDFAPDGLRCHVELPLKGEALGV